MNNKNYSRGTIPENESELSSIEFGIGVFGAILIVIGTIGNVISIAILSRKALLVHPAAVFLLSLAISDIGCLYTGVLRHVITTVWDKDITDISTDGCKYLLWSQYTFQYTSSLLLTAFATLRTIIGTRTRKLKIKRGHSIAIVVLIFVINLLFNLIYVFDHAIKYNTQLTELQCKASKTLRNFIDKVWPWINFTISSLGPFCILLIGHVYFMNKTQHIWSGQQAIAPGDISEPISSLDSRGIRLLPPKIISLTSPLDKLDVIPNAKKRFRATIVTLVSVDLTFFLLTFPRDVYIVLCHSYRKKLLNSIGNKKMKFFFSLLSLFASLSYSMDIFLFSMYVLYFRQALIKAFLQTKMTIRNFFVREKERGLPSRSSHASIMTFSYMP